ncbi:unnamed protein product [Ixodes persulcatus]
MTSESIVDISDLYREVDGLYISKFFDKDVLRSALSYEPRPEEIFIVTYPKCGTTWTQYIVHSILNDGVSPKDFTDFALRSPFLEFLGAEAAEKMIRPGAIKTHLPFNMQPYSENAKYIYVARNPYDCCVSFFYHVKSAPPYGLGDSSFDQFFEMFLSGKVSFGDYFDHLLSWYDHRNDENVLFFTYEDLKKDTRGWVLKIADFLGKGYGAKLRRNEAFLDRVLKDTSFESMKKPVNEGMKTLMPSLLSLPREKQLKSVEVFKTFLDKEEAFVPQGDFIRKGIIGDYKNHFSVEQTRRMKERIAVKTAGSDIMSLWNDIELP